MRAISLQAALFASLFTLSTGCFSAGDGDGSPGGDAGVGADAGPDGGVDGGGDGGTDAGPDAGTDGGSDAGPSHSWPSSADAYVPEDLRYIHTLTLPPQDPQGAESCCVDFTGDGVFDNKWASIMRLVSGFGVDGQGSLDGALSKGELVLLLDSIRPVASGSPGSDALILASLNGAFDVGTDFAKAKAGQGDFMVRRSSYLGSSGEPKEQFLGSMIFGQLSVAGEPLTLTLPFSGASLSLSLEQVSFEATDSAGSYTQGALAAVLPLSAFYGAINDFVASPACSCLGLSGPLYTDDGSGKFTGACVSGAASLCSLPAEKGCTTFAGNDVANGQSCGMLGLLISGDVDLNQDPATMEGISMGLLFEAAPVASSNLEP